MTQAILEPFPVNRVLAQNRPSGTGTTTAYTKPSNKVVTINNIVIANTTGSPVSYSLYICTNGTTYDQTTTIAYSVNIPANDVVIIDLSFTLDTTNGTVGIQSSTGNALNFTILGQIKEYS